MPIAITREPTSASAAKWRDGTYTGLGDSPHGDIEARVVIKDGRIVEAGIATCDTRYPCEVIDPLIHQPVERQSPDVDYMSHATESSDAYYNALVAALNDAVERSSSEAPIPK
jgi:NosR/NirI family nitrous oxide reductase transcriptional regulator